MERSRRKRNSEVRKEDEGKIKQCSESVYDILLIKANTFLQECPQLSEVTPCQVLISNKFEKPSKRMIGIDSKKEFENLLIEIESSGEDPMLFIREEVHGKHISGNHRYHVKQNYMLENREKFCTKP